MYMWGQARNRVDAESACAYQISFITSSHDLHHSKHPDLLSLFKPNHLRGDRIGQSQRTHSTLTESESGFCSLALPGLPFRVYDIKLFHRMVDIRQRTRPVSRSAQAQRAAKDEYKWDPCITIATSNQLGLQERANSREETTIWNDLAACVDRRHKGVV